MDSVIPAICKIFNNAQIKTPKISNKTQIRLFMTNTIYIILFN